jgi:hypothetical protein
VHRQLCAPAYRQAGLRHYLPAGRSARKIHSNATLFKIKADEVGDEDEDEDEDELEFEDEDELV